VIGASAGTAASIAINSRRVARQAIAVRLLFTAMVTLLASGGNRER
jgi:hypothetical protein